MCDGYHSMSQSRIKTFLTETECRYPVVPDKFGAVFRQESLRPELFRLPEVLGVMRQGLDQVEHVGVARNGVVANLDLRVP